MKRLAAIVACLFVLGLAGSGVARRVETGGTSRQPSREAAADRLGALLRVLWPLRLASLSQRVTGFSSWAEADRRYVWLRALYVATGQLARGPQSEARRRQEDAAFSGKMDARLAAQNTPEPSGEEAVVALGRALEEAVPDEGAPGDALCPQLRRGELLRPVPGRVATGFDAAMSGRRGLTLAAPQEAEVLAAAPGRVVFTGVLRGLGQVVILAHGDDCHTVYACLGQVDTAFGETVDRGQALGRTGLCPPAKGPGVYFELRFHKKALNPAEWFAASP